MPHSVILGFLRIEGRFSAVAAFPGAELAAEKRRRGGKIDAGDGLAGKDQKVLGQSDPQGRFHTGEQTKERLLLFDRPVWQRPRRHGGDLLQSEGGAKFSLEAISGFPQDQVHDLIQKVFFEEVGTFGDHFVRGFSEGQKEREYPADRVKVAAENSALENDPVDHHFLVPLFIDEADPESRPGKYRRLGLFDQALQKRLIPEMQSSGCRFRLKGDAGKRQKVHDVFLFLLGTDGQRSIISQQTQNRQSPVVEDPACLGRFHRR